MTDPALPEPRRWSLATEFAVAGGIVMCLAALIVGQWVATRIEAVVVRNWANATALYMESFISPLSQDLAAGDTLSPLAHRALDEVFGNTVLGERVVSYKIWKADGLVVDAADPALVGQRFPETAELARAWAGEVSADFIKPDDAENAAETAGGLPLLEIYSPIREVWSGKVIAVVEFYENAAGLESDIAQARRRSWLTVALAGAVIGALLWGIVARGSRMIESQGAALARQVAALAELSDHNRALRLRVQAAAGRTVALHDQRLRQLGADLHDGPAQLLGYAALRLDGLHRDLPAHAEPVLAEVDLALRDAMREIRAISRGVALPDIAGRDPCDIIEALAEAHRARAGVAVAVDCQTPGLPPLDAASKTCLYRFVQEGLTNGWRHGGGQGQAVRLVADAGGLELMVMDRGPGFAANDLAANGPGARPDPDADGGLGLAGLRDRVEALGGQFEACNRPDGGAMLRMRLAPAQG